MRYFLIFVFFLSAALHTGAQSNNTTPLNKTYALVIGISNYKYSGIDPLMYAHRDAEKFVEYLSSPGGGSVPQTQIRMLTNQKATYGAILQGMQWLLDNAKENDLVYFYFSGHGDVEEQSIYKLGFLFSYDSPRNNFMENTLSIDRLNMLANTLSGKTKAKVILITDACRSGNISEQTNFGNTIMGEQLRTILNNEIRMTSCKPDQLSNEDQAWGGGRGVFSYYLLKGLEGEAEQQKDQVITVQEIQQYLDSALTRDPVLKAKPNPQSPLISGPMKTTVAKVSKIVSPNINIETFGESADAMVRPVTLAPLEKQASSYFFDPIEKLAPENVFNFHMLDTLSAGNIPQAMIQQLKENKEIPTDQTQLDKLLSGFTTNPYTLTRFKEQIVEYLSSRGQEIINLYLNGDQAELEKRKYYNREKEAYAAYPPMYSVALKLSKPNTYIYRMLEVKKYYFTGLSLRLTALKREEIDQAIVNQQKAVALLENAAYIQNELGILYKTTKDFAGAEKAFKRATQIVPKWAIPWSNLASLYRAQGKTGPALEAGQKAISLQSTYPESYYNIAKLYQSMNNWLQAEEACHKSIPLNPKNFQPFEILGKGYLQTTLYPLAEEYLAEAERLKAGILPLADIDNDGVPDIIDDFNMQSGPPVKLDTNFQFQLFMYGMELLGSSEYQVAEKIFLRVIELNPTHPLAWHYLGKIYYNSKRNSEAEIAFQKAKKYHLSDSLFNIHMDTIFIHFKPPHEDEKSRFYMKYKKFAIPNKDNYLFLAATYEQWNHHKDAINEYQTLIRTNPQNPEAYYRLWLFYEKHAMYFETERVIQQFAKVDPAQAEFEWYEFYKRMSIAFPMEYRWPYQVGLIAYSHWSLPVRGENRHHSFRFYNRNDEFHRLDPIINKHDFPEGGISLPPYTVAPASKFDLREGIQFLNDAENKIRDRDSLLLADIYSKLGDLHSLNNNPREAIQSYAKALNYHPNLANDRMYSIDQHVKIKQFSEAFNQLDSLYLHQQINQVDLLLYIEYAAHAGLYSKADSALKFAQSLQLIPSFELLELEGLNTLLSCQPAKALVNYQNVLKSTDQKKHVWYTLARIYSMLHQDQEAWAALNKAIEEGFNYRLVLQYDEIWNAKRNDPEWAGLMQKLK
ncbi:MAG: caspase family protein [Chitinophagaceae bacterium]|nr:caspase family protein [Chitinophagaceae bacterium]